MKHAPSHFYNHVYNYSLRMSRKPTWYMPLLVISLLLFVSCQPAARPVLPGVDMVCQPGEISVFQGEKALVTFTMTNRLAETIRTESNYFLSYHLYDEKGKLVAFDNRRYALPRVLRRNKTTAFEIPMFFSFPQSGKYLVEFDIVKEGAYWGSEKKWQTCRVKLHLKPLVSAEFKQKYMSHVITTDNPLFDQEQYLLRLTFKNSEKQTGDGKLFGFSAGSDYPQVWIRDTATFIRYALLFYPRDTLENSVEQFLLYQGVDGEILDWVDMSGQTGKNTVETDQESSLVLAAEPIALSHPAWLARDINGKTILERLNMALEWVWEKKRDVKQQLITSGFTADWGDTENTFPDQRATQLSDKSTLVFAIYTQAKYIQAIQSLLRVMELNNGKGSSKPTELKKWKQRLSTLKQQTFKQLYLQDKGYFITHMVQGADREKYFKLEQDILPVGGNAEAILAGLMDRQQIQRFIEVLEQRRQEYQLRTVSFTLLPPYPEGFFPHHLLRHPWSYQNGGEWDWIGARVVKALLLNGFRQEALVYLQEIVKKNLANYCIYEWEDRGGTGRGALFYAGAAGLIGETLLLAYPK